MTKTEKYQLNQWEASDRILREDFNNDNANLESSLAALQAALDQEVSARKSAVSSASTTAANNLATAKTQLNSTITAAKNAAAADLAAHVAEMPFAKLAEVTVSTAAVQVDVDLSGISLPDYAYLLVVPRLNTGGTAIIMQVNGLYGKYSSGGSSGKAGLCTISPLDDDYTTRIHIMGFGQSIRCAMEQFYAIGHGSVPYSAVVENDTLTADTFNQLNFYTSDKTAKIKVGSKITVYGVRL